MARLFTVIPTLNAAARLERTLASLAEAERAGLSGGWLVSDAGSEDGAIDLARRAGCWTITTARGRGAQLAAGAQAVRARMAAEDWLLFLHADTALSPGWSAAAARFMAEHGAQDRAGYFRFALDDPAPGARRLERAVAWRCKRFSLPYGDQGLMLSAAFYDRLGGFKPWPLFEDVDLVRRIGARRLAQLPARAVTSADRFQAEGYRRRSAKNLVLLTRYFLGADPARLARAYRK